MTTRRPIDPENLLDFPLLLPIVVRAWVLDRNRRLVVLLPIFPRPAADAANSVSPRGFFLDDTLEGNRARPRNFSAVL